MLVDYDPLKSDTCAYDQATTQFTLHLTTDEVRTIYWSLREHRDSLNKSLTESELKEHRSFNSEYEDQMFLHEQLYKVNAMLFNLLKNHDTLKLNAIQDALDVE